MYKVMIVDDSTIIRNRIERCFSSTQFKVVAIAGDGQKAVNQFRLHKPEIVTMDLTMPNMDGLQCISKLRLLNPNVNILVVSALSDKMTGLKALQLGARGFICKPFTDEQLIAALEKIVATKIKRDKKAEE